MKRKAEPKDCTAYPFYYDAPRHPLLLNSAISPPQGEEITPESPFLYGADTSAWD